jgi:ribonuclease HI
VKRGILIYTDGSYSIKYNVGSWAFVVVPCEGKSVTARRSNGVVGTTNNRMELEAIIRAVAYAIKEFPDDNVIIRTDSKYSITVLRSTNPANANWIGVQTGRMLIKTHGRIYLEWVKGHSDDSYNRLADVEATVAKRRLIAARIAAKEADKPLAQRRNESY